MAHTHGENRKKMVRSAGKAAFYVAHRSHLSKGAVQKWVGKRGIDDVFAEQCKKLARIYVKPSKTT